MSTLVADFRENYPVCTVKKQLKEPITSLKIALRVLSHNDASICIYTGHLYVGDERTPEPTLWNFGKNP